MNIHPLLQSPLSILVYQHPFDDPAYIPQAANGSLPWETFRVAAIRAMNLFQVSPETDLRQRIVIKPNDTSGEHFANPDTGITTHPGFIQGMVEYLRAKGTKSDHITILEDPRNTDDNTPRHWRGTGYDLLAQETGVRLHSPTTYTCVKKRVPNPMTFPVLNVSRLAVAQGTFLINVPKLKTHNLGITTLCMKNLMGAVNVFDRHYCAQAWGEMPADILLEQRPRLEWFDREKHELWQEALARRLVDTAQVIQPALNIVEGIIGREGTGFQRGRNRSLGLVVAGINMVAVDSLVSYMMGFDPLEVVYLRMAARAGLGENDVNKLQIYLMQGGEAVPCPDPQVLRIHPPMRVIMNIKGEEPVDFNQASFAIPDTTASQDFFQEKLTLSQARKT